MSVREPFGFNGGVDGAQTLRQLLRDDILFGLRLRHDGKEYQASVGDVTDVAGDDKDLSSVMKVTFSCGDLTSPLVGTVCVSRAIRSAAHRFELSIGNPQAMDHPGGNWDLGAAGSVVIEEFSVTLQPKAGDSFSGFSIDLQDVGETVRAEQSLNVFQASSGGLNWQSSNHIDRFGKVPWPFRGYRVDADGEKSSGLRARPILRARLGSWKVAIACRHFWQNFPSSLSAQEHELTLGLFPADSPGGHELQGGEQKTFEFAIERADDETTSVMDQFTDALIAREDSEGFVKAKSLPYLMPRGDHSDPRYEALVDLAIEGDDTFAIKSEKIDQFGWRNFGDLYGDHEAVHHRGDSPMISHYNNQYDCTLGFAIQFLRTGDQRWFDLMTQMADHAWDIDSYHTDQDKLLYNGGLFWHTYHYADAHTATHRSYPKQLRVSQSFDGGTDLSELGETGETLAKVYAIGGGPAAAHNYSTGWMVAYYLTGKERYKTAAINAADYVMRIDDGSKTPFKWLSRADTGYSTNSSEGYYGPGRASANSTHALLTGHELTGDEKYLRRAALLMRRTVHPNQDLDALDLLNAELRWFYTMYLQALGRLIDYKDSLGQRDADFEYGVASLLHYADWMARRERPTLSEPEKLQYPNETWAAQDMRKWHVLQHATLYQCDPEKRKRLQEKAEFFFNDVCDSLSSFPTKSLCRPVILMLNFGWQRDWFLANREQLRLDRSIEKDFGKPKAFVPQRTIAIRRFKRLVVACGVAFMLLVVGLILWAIGLVGG